MLYSISDLTDIIDKHNRDNGTSIEYPLWPDRRWLVSTITAKSQALSSSLRYRIIARDKIVESLVYDKDIKKMLSDEDLKVHRIIENDKELMHTLYDQANMLQKRIFRKAFPDDFFGVDTPYQLRSPDIIAEEFGRLTDEKNIEKASDDIKNMLYERFDYEEMKNYLISVKTESNPRPQVERGAHPLLEALNKRSGLKSDWTNRIINLSNLADADEDISNDYNIRAAIHNFVSDSLAAYQAHDPAALRYYKDRLNRYDESLSGLHSSEYNSEKSKSEFIEIMRSLNMTLLNLRHLRESGSVIIPELQAIWAHLDKHSGDTVTRIGPIARKGKGIIQNVYSGIKNPKR